jgi:hypothetical protein
MQRGIGMNRIITKISVVILIAMGAIGGCGGSSGSGSCDFDFNSFLNGANADEAFSQWSCVGSKPGSIVLDFVFQAFEDETGFSTNVGPFTYEQTGCRSIRFQSGLGDGNVINLDGSNESGILTFDQTSSTPGLDGISSGCLLEVF